MSSLNRRAILAGALISVAATATAAVASIPTAATSSAEWDAAMSIYVNAERAAQADDEVYARIREAWLASEPSEDMIDWPSFPFSNRRHVAHTLDLDNAETAFLAGKGRVWWGDTIQERQLKGFRSVREYRAARDVNNQRHGLDVAASRNDAFGEAAYKAKWALLKMPAPHLQALLWKLEVLFGDDGFGSTTSWALTAVEPTMRDAQRLLGGDAQ